MACSLGEPQLDSLLLHPPSKRELASGGGQHPLADRGAERAAPAADVRAASVEEEPDPRPDLRPVHGLHGHGARPPPAVLGLVHPHQAVEDENDGRDPDEDGGAQHKVQGPAPAGVQPHQEVQEHLPLQLLGAFRQGDLPLVQGGGPHDPEERHRQQWKLEEPLQPGVRGPARRHHRLGGPQERDPAALQQGGRRRQEARQVQGEAQNQDHLGPGRHRVVQQREVSGRVRQEIPAPQLLPRDLRPLQGGHDRIQARRRRRGLQELEDRRGGRGAVPHDAAALPPEPGPEVPQRAERRRLGDQERGLEQDGRAHEVLQHPEPGQRAGAEGDLLGEPRGALGHHGERRVRDRGDHRRGLGEAREQGGEAGEEDDRELRRPGRRG
mmetsp:Transcript_9648/g.18118  ORF Transcript_9648/g.18118 Transcript_9648/m.18118 type:complete len:382 (-) Transcript_9648:5402-6547(-)